MAIVSEPSITALVSGVYATLVNTERGDPEMAGEESTVLKADEDPELRALGSRLSGAARRSSRRGRARLELTLS